ncbi:Thymidine cytosolic [Brachionus plicatilis]|uniref:Thymidine kinase n=1 Tax=Brachionus plicatilis TaxID=10195 RepID=A0A3M7SWM5_BRAPC|nr:Thymidine cytosolic [Brachionus plicatilis]
MSKGQIQLILGPMFSGKTTELIRRMRRYETANHKCMVIKYEKDNRYDDTDAISTHDKHMYSANVKTSCLLDQEFSALKYSVIGIDEGQFYKDVVEFCEKMANMGKIVIVAALDGTYQRKGFGSILELVPLAESIVKLTAVCMYCYNDAAFTKRKGNETQIELIGGKESYLAVCRTCYFAQSPLKTALKENKAQFSNITNVDQIYPPKQLKISSEIDILFYSLFI